MVGTTPMTMSFQWRRCNKRGRSCVNIAGGVASTFRLTSAQVGYRICALVTATNVAGEASARTVLSAVVKA